MDREKVIKGIDICLGHGKCDDCGYRIKGGYSTMDCRKPMMRDALALLKEQEEWLRKFQKDKDKLCLEVSEWKHKFHDRPVQDKENGHWIVLEYCANEGIYCSKCLNKIFDRSTKPKKKLSNYCPNCGSKNTHFFNPSTEKIMYSD